MTNSKAEKCAKVRVVFLAFWLALRKRVLVSVNPLEEDEFLELTLEKDEGGKT